MVLHPRFGRKLNIDAPYGAKALGLTPGGLGAFDCKLLKTLVGERGFEPPTPWSRTRCSTRLSHSPNMGCRSVSLGRGLARIPLDYAPASVADVGLRIR